jgi:uncharacterized cupin superfamily protein
MPLRMKPSNYPEPFFGRMSKRQKRPLADMFGLKNFGVNLTTLLPGGESALLHTHPEWQRWVTCPIAGRHSDGRSTPKTAFVLVDGRLSSDRVSA